MLEKEKLHPKQIDTYIFDMDGVIYQLDGMDNGYKGSTLENFVVQNAIKLIALLEDKPEAESREIVRSVQEQGVYLSLYFEQKYGMSRADYFNKVWDIEPQSIVKNFEISKVVLQRLSKESKRLFLLSSSPQIWINKVLAYLKLEDVFQRRYSGEFFVSKEEIFAQLAKEFDPTSVLALGDQVHTDIEPAEKFGFRTLHVTSPEVLNALLIPDLND